MERMQARINTYVPEKLKSRLDRLADASGLKSSDLVRRFFAIFSGSNLKKSG